MTLKIGIIGGGAAGIFAAIVFKEFYPAHEVTVLEQSSSLLRKVKISGGGRCNVTHACFDPAELAKNYPRGDKELRGAFYSFQPQDMIDWFKKYNIALKKESDGRIFPESNDSQTIIDCFLDRTYQLDIKIIKNFNVHHFTKINSQFLIQNEDKQEHQFDKLLIATGGNTGFRIHQSIEQLGHSINPLIPSLFTFNLQNSTITQLSGVVLNSVEVKISESNLKQTGNLLITHWGVSGPVVLKLSAFAAHELYHRHYQYDVLIDHFPSLSHQEIVSTLKEARNTICNKTLLNCGLFDLPKRYWQWFLSFIRLNSEKVMSSLSNIEIENIAHHLKKLTLHANGKTTFKEEFVTAGGIHRSEIQWKTMESKLVSGLYFAGEVIDVDGVTGGFNFQNAWTTAYLAARAMGKASELKLNAL